MLLVALLIVLGGLVMTGVEKQLETLLVEASPACLTKLTTQF